MSRAAVRAAITQYLTNGDLPFVGSVLRARPYRIEAPLFKKTPAVPQSSGAVIVVHLPEDQEDRTALGGPKSGEKFNVHKTVLEILFQSSAGEAEGAQDDHDTLIDALMALLRADRILGAKGVIWQSGQGKPMGYHLQLSAPRLGKSTVNINASLTFNCWEYVQA